MTSFAGMTNFMEFRIFTNSSRRRQMKTSRLFWIAVFLMAAGLLHDAPALGQSPSCYILASMEKTRIFVRELNQDGNPLRGLDSEWSGWVNQGDQMPITSREKNSSLGVDRCISGAWRCLDGNPSEYGLAKL
jgi:hypothetical protein